jgi:tRNA-Thr(GGU) m(6)t(6)A37 methyltransferase TsaA
MSDKSVQYIARIHTDFPDKFGVPRQSGLAPSLQATIVMEPEFRDPQCFRGLEEFSHVWLLWDFDQVGDWRPTVRPPRLGGNTRMGVFATRSPFRPNAIGMSCVRLLEIHTDEKLGPVLVVAGADLVDHTPIIDIKPYLPYVDCYPDASGGFTEHTGSYFLQVEIPERLLSRIPKEKQAALRETLSLDPRPAYQDDKTREYGMRFDQWNVRFRVEENQCKVVDICSVS